MSVIRERVWDLRALTSVQGMTRVHVKRKLKKKEKHC